MTSHLTRSGLPTPGRPDRRTWSAWGAHLGTGDSDRVWSTVEGLGQQTLVDLADETARRHGKRPAIRVGGVGLSHEQLADRSTRLAGALAERGAGPGTRVLLAARNSIDFVVSYVAALRAGAAVAMANPALTPPELATLIGDADPILAVADPERVAVLDDLDFNGALVEAEATGPRSVEALATTGQSGVLRYRPAPDDVAHLAFTSGTTGRAKATPLTHANVVASIQAAALAWRWRDDDVLVHSLPLQHAHGLTGVHAALVHGSLTVVLPSFDPEQMLSAVHDLPATVLFAVPTIYERLLEAGLPLDPLRSLRLATSGSAPLSPHTFEALHELTGTPPLERYGCTEAGYSTSNPIDGERRAGSVGIPLPGVQVEIVDSHGQPVGVGEEGEIVVAGPQVFSGYVTGGEGAFLPGPWFRTGDMASEDPETGHLTISGRAKELIISGGLNVYPREVEVALEAVPGVTEAAVVGVPSEKWGEQVVAYVVASEGMTEDAVRSAVTDKLAPYKRPKVVTLVDELPRNSMGKIMRRSLVEDFTGQQEPSHRE